MCSVSEVAFTFEVDSMAEAGENFAAFNSRALVEMVGGVTDEALKATRIKKFLSVLAGRYFNWAGRKSLFTLHLGIKCCAIEMAAAATPRFDGDRFGVLFRSSPRQSDVLLINGPITKKFADKVVRLWEQMPEPKYCIAMGECAISGGPYSNPTTSSKVSTPSFQSMFTSQDAHLAQKHSSMDLGCCVRKSFVLVEHQALSE